MEQTFLMIKPDGVQRGLVGEVIGRFEKKGFYLKGYPPLDSGVIRYWDPHASGLKLMNVERSLAEKHYGEHASKPFFPALVEYIISGPVVAMVWEGVGVIATCRKLIGATNPLDSAPGTIRGDFAIAMKRNIIHGSDSVESAKKEMALWFPEGIAQWQSSLHNWINE